MSNALNAFAIESFVDELAREAGRSPLEFRLAMLGKQPRQRAVLERAALESGFKAARDTGRAFGVASMKCYDSHMALVAEVSGSAESVKVERLTYAVDCGTAVHPDQVIAQLQSGAVTGLIEIVLMPNGDAPGGIGEAGVPLVAPAIANAVFALTGQRIRGLPLEDAGIRFS